MGYAAKNNARGSRGLEMTRYRIKIERIGHGEFMHIFNICFDAKDILAVRAWLELMFHREIGAANERLIQYINSQNKWFIDKIRAWDADLIDWESKGKDISKTEYLENEVYSYKYD